MAVRRWFYGPSPAKLILDHGHEYSLSNLTRIYSKWSLPGWNCLSTPDFGPDARTYSTENPFPATFNAILTQATRIMLDLSLIFKMTVFVKIYGRSDNKNYVIPPLALLALVVLSAGENNK